MANTLLNETYIEEFISSLLLPPTANVKAIGLLTTMEDCLEFEAHFLGNNKQVIRDLTAYAKYKRGLLSNKPTFDALIYDVENKGVKMAFEKAFMCYLNEVQVKSIEEHIEHNPSALKHILEAYLMNPEINIMRHVL